MIIKQVPEDFVVDEIPLDFDNQGGYSVILVKKRDIDTEQVAAELSKSFNIPRKNIGYSGSKDKFAQCTQYFSVKNVKIEKLENKKFNKFSLKWVANNSEPLTLGSLKGNIFTITVRDLKKETAFQSRNLFPNYYGEQRFSHSNHLIGQAILKKEFKIASEYLKDDKKYSEIMNKHLKTKLNDYVGAVNKLPRSILRLYLHSFQSRLFNLMLCDIVNKNYKKNRIVKFLPDSLIFPEISDKGIQKEISEIDLPVIGFDTEVTDEVNRILNIFSMTLVNFIIRQIPNMSLEGDSRKAFVEMKDLEISDAESDNLNKGKYKRKISFELPKGSYATIALKSLTSDIFQQKLHQ